MEARGQHRTNVHPKSSPADRLAAVGNQMIEIHLWLGAELARLRESLDDPDGAGRSRDLRAHCLSFCAALGRHHTGEDDGAFRLLADQVPELRPVIANLITDHEVVAGILHRVEALLGTDTSMPAAQVRAELDGLAALLESHFRYEEKRLVTALNALSGQPGTAEELLGLTAPPRPAD
ncbi:hemerythrin domain-containing protein [Micromonospora orduensis]|uniref:Hemerythrin domain-containing protein n=1 Tax=Micromonospora orduensis TaxID=1420891 RepID=A0A5C4QTR7_9ACTN|nr:hemerythrin domain-containing protein [Micromonospora orduensis]TNH29859.1 hemerythrin domain-containing protein [Micromonospora orduensis]